jgi:hypothetical protein
MTEQNQKLDQGSTPSAFPSSGLEYTEKGKSWAQAGMTLRDYFAAKAMQGLLANSNLRNETLNQGGCLGGWLESSSYGFADAMLRARTK